MATDEQQSDPATWLDLYDWRRRVAAQYARREADHLAGADPLTSLLRFRAAKNDLFARHPQTPLDAEARRRFSGLRYFPYAPGLRIEADLTPLPETPDEAEMAASGPHAMRFRRAARVSFAIEGFPLELYVYWIDVYGGGLFLPFRDATCPDESYGGGRYLFDTVKGSEFLRVGEPSDAHPSRNEQAIGYAGGRILLDFNYAYNPSCAYDARWICPLAPNENRLPLPIRAGERKYHD